MSPHTGALSESPATVRAGVGVGVAAGVEVGVAVGVGVGVAGAAQATVTSSSSGVLVVVPVRDIRYCIYWPAVLGIVEPLVMDEDHAVQVELSVEVLVSTVKLVPDGKFVV